ncbi:hypothetical protein D3C87_125230 [compost metagenome]
MKQGTYKVLSIVDAGLIGEGEGTKPKITFSLETDEGVKNLTWFGNMKGNTPEGTEKARQMTIKALVTAGFIGNDFDDLLQPVDAVFNTKELTVTVELYKDKPQIKWINEKREKKEFTGVAPKFAALFAQVKKDMGVETIPF